MHEHMVRKHFLNVDFDTPFITHLTRGQYFMLQFECCGIRGYEDWKGFASHHCEDTKSDVSH